MGLSRNVLLKVTPSKSATQAKADDHQFETPFRNNDSLNCATGIAGSGDPQQPTESYSKLEKEAER
jgi:hypothetical protein